MIWVRSLMWECRILRDGWWQAACDVGLLEEAVMGTVEMGEMQLSSEFVVQTSVMMVGFVSDHCGRGSW